MLVPVFTPTFPPEAGALGAGTIPLEEEEGIRFPNNPLLSETFL